MTEQIKKEVLPVYLVLDSSGSMDENGAFDAAMKFLPSLYVELIKSESLADKLRIEVITFDKGAERPVPLSDRQQLENYMKKLEANPIVPDGGATYYGEAFRMLRTEIELGVKQLKSDGYEVHRPVAFLITDGLPNDEPVSRKKNYTELTDSSFSYRPNLICVGVGDATKAGLTEYGASSYKMGQYTTGNEYVVLVPRDGVTPAKAVNAIIPTLVQSIIGSITTTAKKIGGVSDPFGGQQESIFDELEEDFN
jgi:uncharacterized protein YegL